jgi:hypothetical protein
MRSAASRSLQPSAGHCSSPASRCNGDGSFGHTKRDRRPSVSHDVELQSGLHAHAVHGADAAEELEGLAIRTGHDVLAVVHRLAGGRIDERRRPPAQRRPRLEHQHAGTERRQ